MTSLSHVHNRKYGIPFYDNEAAKIIIFTERALVTLRDERC